MKENLKGKYVIVRGDRSGVFFGILENQNKQEVELKQCRRLWYWDGACSISELALNGTAQPNDCKFTVTIDEILIIDGIEIIEDILPKGYTKITFSRIAENENYRKLEIDKF